MELKKCKDPKIINDVKERISWIVSICPLEEEFASNSDLSVFSVCTGYNFRSLPSIFVNVILVKWPDVIYMSFQDKQLKSDSAKHIDAEILANHKKKERDAAKQGKRPFYLKKCNASFHLSFPSLPMQPLPWFWMWEMQFLWILSVFVSSVIREAKVENGAQNIKCISSTWGLVASLDRLLTLCL